MFSTSRVQPVVFVIGATGHVGTATIASLSAKHADRVEIRAGVRNPEKAEKLKAIPNVTVVEATMGDSNLVGVLTGVDTLYIVTPGTDNRDQIAISTAESAKQAGVKHIAVVSGPQADLPYSQIGRQLSEVEAKVSNLGVPYTFIRLPMFMENYSWFLKGTSRGQGSIHNAIDPAKLFTSAALKDIGTASAAILVNPEKYANKALTIVSDLHSYNDFTRVLSETTGKEIKYIRVPYKAAKKIMTDASVSEWLAEEVVDLSKLINASSPAVTECDLGEYKMITGEEPTDLSKWITEYSNRGCSLKCI